MMGAGGSRSRGIRPPETRATQEAGVVDGRVDGTIEHHEDRVTVRRAIRGGTGR